jgi:poly(A) polymerase/tRNA nucleotidyltransferase (CCA-adding enzyme)
MEKIELDIPKEIIFIGKTLQNNGFDAYLVGGSVRDITQKKTPKDWDIATDARPEEITGLFPESFYDNSYGTVEVINDTEKTELKTVEITTYRTEDIYSDNRHPDEIAFSDSIKEDLKRRDFTINALALDLHQVSREKLVMVSQETLVDYHGGLKDLQNNILRTVGDAQTRLQEDPLRILRGVRFSGELSLTIERKTKKAMKSLSSRLNDIPVERIREEFEKIIMSSNPKLALEIGRAIGVLEVFLPELLNTVGVEQNQAHEFDLWGHLIGALQASSEKNWPKHIRLAALFHDIGKVQTREWSEKRGDWSFHNHEVVGSHVTEDILERLKFSNDLISQVTNLVRWHMFYSDTDEITHSAVRRLVKNVGKDNVWDLMKLRRADRIGMGRPKEQPYRLRKYQSMIEEVIRDPVSTKNLAIDGDDVIDETNEEPGPRIGYILHGLLEKVLDDPERNKRGYLLKKADQLSKLSDEDLKKVGESGKSTKKKKEAAAKKEIRDKYWVT